MKKMIIAVLLLTMCASIVSAQILSEWRGPNRDGIAPETGWSSEGSTSWSVNVGLGYSAVAVQG